MPDPKAAIVAELRLLIQSFHAVVAIESPEEERVREYLRAAGVDLYIPLNEWSTTRGLRNQANRDGVAGTTDPKKLLEYLLGVDTSGIFLLLDFTRHLDDAKVARLFREVAQHFQVRQSTIVLCGDPLTIPPEIRHLVTPFDLPLPTAAEVTSVVVRTVQALASTNKIQINIDQQGQQEFVRHLGGLTLAQARQAVAYCVLDNHRLDLEDLRGVLSRKARLLGASSAVDFIPVEANRGDLGGFASLKAWLTRARHGFSQKARDLGLQPPRGILIVGVQGCGKSLAAKAVAREWGLPLLKFDAGKLYDKYVGESERNFRRALASAEAMAPAVLWIDELEKAMGSVTSSETDGGLSRRIFGAFLTWLQERRSEVFLVATANDLMQLPPEFLRKGRFDEIFFVDLPDEAERRAIFAIHLRQRNQDPEGFALDEFARISVGYSGAEIEQAIVAALYRALSLDRDLDSELVLAEIRYLIPLSRTRREDVERLRSLAADRFVNVR